MTNRFVPEDIIREIRDKCDIYEVISSYIPLKKSGNRWIALCPFHKEKTPSFFVSPERQAYHCFGCGKGGNVFTFIMEKENVDFVNAANILASKSGVIIPETKSEGNSASVDKKNKQQDRLYQLHQTLAEIYHKFIFSEKGKIGLQYLSNRNISKETIDQFKLGYAPDSWDFAINQLQSLGYSSEELTLSGVAVDNQENNSKNIYDRFRNRIIFPIWNTQGKVVAFSSRAIEENHSGGKYVNSPETPIFKKSNILYALPFAKNGIHDKKFVILCEGQLDVIAMHKAGFNNAVAPQGTAFTEQQAILLKRYTNKIYICFDGDDAGINATLRAIDLLLPLDLEIKIISLPKGEDPDSIFNKQGKKVLEEYTNKASDFFDFLLKTLSQAIDTSSPYGKSNLVAKVLEKILLINSSVIRASYATLLASKLSLPESSIFSELNKLYKKKGFRTQNKTDQNNNANVSVVNPVVEKAEEILLELAILHGSVGKRLEQELPHDLISNSLIGNALNIAISMTINGEWEHVPNELNMLLNESPNNKLTKILAGETNVSNNSNIDKAVTECIKKIKFANIEEQITDLMNKMKSTTDDNGKKEIIEKITGLQKERHNHQQK